MDTEVVRNQPCWEPEIDSDLTCIDVHAETHDVKTFTFVSTEGKRFDFQAGQYFSFSMSVGGEDETRCYSISSSPLRQNAFSVTIKRVTGGKVSNWFHDTVVSGTTIRAAGPLGQFTRPPRAEKLLLLSGGSGITPVMSMARELNDRSMPVDVVFLHAGRSPLDLVFRDELSAIANRLKGFRLYFLPETLDGERSWPGVSGRISRPLLELLIPDLAERTILCCGPAPFMQEAKQIARDLKVPVESYIEESFTAAVIEEATTPLAEVSNSQVFTVEFAKQKRVIEVSAEQSVLSVAKKAGVKLPSSCSNGLCGTCKSKLLSGSVDMNHNGGIRQREIDAGLFLPCCSKPLSDLVIDR